MTTITVDVPPAGEVPPALPPYSGPNTLCPKCANPEAFTRYRPAMRRCMDEYNGSTNYRGPLPERLERQCMRCDYQWDEALVTDLPPMMTVDQLVRALDDSTPYPIELRADVAQFVAERLLERLHISPRLDHQVWDPEGDAQPATVDPLPELDRQEQL